MNVNDYLKKVAYVAPSGIPDDDGEVYLSIFDGSYITRVGLEDDIKFLAEREITEELTHGVGFSPKDQKWYGWSHRAIFGFTIGSTCKKGNCHYMPVDKDDFLDGVVRFWSDAMHLHAKGEHVVLDDGTEGVNVTWVYSDAIPNKELRNKISGCFQPYPEKYGRGEWAAETLEDAKQMAIDFRNGVS